MPIKNYSSKKSPAESIGNIQKLLAEHGARNISIDYSPNAEPEALEFTMQVGADIIPFRLTVDSKGMLQAMKEDSKVPKSNCNIEQAKRTAWKNKYEWLHIQLAEIASNQARIEQLLLGYAVTENGQTAFERLKEGSKLLTQ